MPMVTMSGNFFLTLYSDSDMVCVQGLEREMDDLRQDPAQSGRSTPGPSVSDCPTLGVAGAARCRPQNPVQWAMAPRVGELTPSLDGRKVRCDEEAIRREVRTLKLRHFSLSVGASPKR